MAHERNKGGEKHTKRAAQKNLKQKRAEKKAKRSSAAQTSTVHITTESQ